MCDKPGIPVIRSKDHCLYRSRSSPFGCESYSLHVGRHSFSPRYQPDRPQLYPSKKTKCAPKNVSSGRLWSVIKQNRKICLTFAYLALYIGFLNLIGFWIMTALFLFFEISLLCPKEKQNRPLIILFSIIVSGAVYFAFTELFHVMLPAGILEGWI